MLKVWRAARAAREQPPCPHESARGGLLSRTVGRLQVMSKRASAVSIEDLVASIETARDKVMADEVKSLVKLGLPKTVAYKMVADRYRQRAEGDDGEADSASPWPDMS